MPTIHLRFYEELNDFLPQARRKTRFAHTARPSATLREVIESLGVPHSQVDLILVNGKSVDFSYLPKTDDEISVYPLFESFDITPVTRLQSRPLRKTRFVLDVHLGKLARYLRMMGFDSAYEKSLTDDEIIEIMEKERRTILTRDRNLLKRSAVTHGYFIRTTQPEKQATEVLRRFDLVDQVHPMSRCLHCNSKVAAVDKKQILDQLPAKVQSRYEEFNQCPQCRRIYWQGIQTQRMFEIIDHILKEAQSPRA